MAAQQALQAGGQGPSAPAPVESTGSPDELLVLEARLGAIVLADALIGYRRDDGIVFVPLGALATALEFPIRVDADTPSAVGWFLDETRTFSLDPARGSVRLAGGERSFDPGLVALRDGELFVATPLLEGWWPIDLDVDISQLRVTVSARETLPFQQRRERAARHAQLRSGVERSVVGPRVRLPYQLFGGLPSSDFAITVGRRRNGDAELRHATQLDGEFLGMTTRSVIVGDRRSLTDLTLTLERKDPAGALLGPLGATSLVVGRHFSPDVGLVTRGAPSTLGMEVSNFPLNQPSSLGVTTIRGDVPAGGWEEVELYRDGALLDFQQLEDDRQYNFVDVGLRRGLNVFRVVSYGPGGGTRETVHRVFAGTGLIRPGGRHYRFAAGIPDDGRFRPDEGRLRNPQDGHGRLSFEYQQGLTSGLSVGAGLASLRLDGGRRNYVNLNTSAAVPGGVFVQAEVSQADTGGGALQVRALTKLLGLDLYGEHEQFGDDFVSERVDGTIDPLQRRSSVRVHGMLPFSTSSRVPFSVRTSLGHRRSGQTTQDASARFSVYPRLLRGTSITNTLSWTSRNGGRSAAASETRGTVLMSALRRRLSLRGELGYELDPDPALRNLRLTAGYNLSNRLRLDLSADRRLTRDPGTRLGVRLRRRFDSLTLGLDTAFGQGGFTFSVSTSIGLGPKGPTGGWAMRPDRRIQTGAVWVRVFLDNNWNGRLDDGDEPLSGVRFLETGDLVRDVETGVDGRARISPLPAYRLVTLSIDESSLEHPYAVPTRDAVTVVPRPGSSAVMDLPVVLSSELGGRVTLLDGDLEHGAANVVLQLVDAGGDVVGDATTGSDGFYLFAPSVRPGPYTVRVSPAQLERLSLVAEPWSRQVVIAPAGFVDGLDFTVVRSGD